jgi:hypothetical protein
MSYDQTLRCENRESTILQRNRCILTWIKHQNNPSSKKAKNQRKSIFRYNAAATIEQQINHSLHRTTELKWWFSETFSNNSNNTNLWLCHHQQSTVDKLKIIKWNANWNPYLTWKWKKLKSDRKWNLKP